jgi:hypothetical protein
MAPNKAGGFAATGNVDIGLCLKQRENVNIHILFPHASNRPLKYSRAVRIQDVDVCSTLQQRLDGSAIDYGI